MEEALGDVGRRRSTAGSSCDSGGSSGDFLLRVLVASFGANSGDGFR